MRILALSELTGYLQMLLDADPVLSDVWVEGEVSNFSRAASGHCYWTLKDDEAQLRAVCFRSHASRITRMPQHGERVLAHGRVAFYGGSGQLQFYVDLVRPAGVGLLHARFEELKQRLAAEGLFDAGRKRLLPPLPRRIGVVTSPGAAAWRDILNVLRRRNPLLEVVLSPCLVQGSEAPDSIVEALYALYDVPALDLIIVSRGGGSLEDLWAFNEEAVARAAFASPVPLISGVGHETDTTIIDYVSDLRAPTPSAAAELAAPPVAALAEAVVQAQLSLGHALHARLAEHADQLNDLGRRLHQRSPVAQLDRQRLQVDEAVRRAGARVEHTLALRRAQHQGVAARLATLDPRATLERGYALVTRQSDGRLVTSPKQVVPGEAVRVQVRGGAFDAVRDV